MRRRGPQTLARITYPTLSEWTGLAVGTLRNLASEGQLPRDLPGVITWVNTRRARQGLPLIGLPDHECHHTLEGEPTITIELDGNCSCGYNPVTGEYLDAT